MGERRADPSAGGSQAAATAPPSFLVYFFRHPPVEALPFLVALIIFLLSSLLYIPLEGWNAGECVYFALVVLSTVGYGDLLPTSDGSKVFTAFFILWALIVAAVALAGVLDAAAEFVTARAAQEQGNSEAGLFDKVGRQAESRRKMIRDVSIFVSLCLIGTIIAAETKDWSKQGTKDGNRYVNGFYYTIVTLTTVGFGDYSADGGKEQIGAIITMLLGIPAFGAALSSLSSYMFGAEQEERRLKLVKCGVTGDSLEAFEAFSRRLASEAQAGNDSSDGIISRFEFLCFILVENGICSLGNIRDAMLNFRELDINNGGEISKEDLDCWLQRRQKDQRQSPRAPGQPYTFQPDPPVGHPPVSSTRVSPAP